MLTTIFLLILIYSLLGKPVGRLLNRLKEVNWSELVSNAWDAIKSFGLRAGRTTCTPLLYFYYVMKDKRTTVSDKALVYGAILYIISPFDLLPKRILGLFGILDDVTIAALVLNKIQAKITPEIDDAVRATLEEWFGTTAITECISHN